MTPANRDRENDKRAKREALHEAGGPTPKPVENLSHSCTDEEWNEAGRAEEDQEPAPYVHRIPGAKLFGAPFEIVFHADDMSAREIEHAVRAMTDGLKRYGFKIHGEGFASGGIVTHGKNIFPGETLAESLPEPLPRIPGETRTTPCSVCGHEILIGDCCTRCPDLLDKLRGRHRSDAKNEPPEKRTEKTCPDCGIAFDGFRDDVVCACCFFGRLEKGVDPNVARPYICSACRCSIVLPDEVSAGICRPCETARREAGPGRFCQECGVVDPAGGLAGGLCIPHRKPVPAPTHKRNTCKNCGTPDLKLNRLNHCEPCAKL